MSRRNLCNKARSIPRGLNKWFSMLNKVQNTHETQKKFNSEVTFPKFFISEFRIIEFENPNSKFYLTKQLLNNVANIDQNNAISSLCKGYQQFGIRYRLFCIHYKTSQAYVIDHETFFSGDDFMINKPTLALHMASYTEFRPSRNQKPLQQGFNQPCSKSCTTI